MGVSCYSFHCIFCIQPTRKYDLLFTNLMTNLHIFHDLSFQFCARSKESTKKSINVVGVCWMALFVALATFSIGFGCEFCIGWIKNVCTHGVCVFLPTATAPDSLGQKLHGKVRKWWKCIESSSLRWNCTCGARSCTSTSLLFMGYQHFEVEWYSRHLIHRPW